MRNLVQRAGRLLPLVLALWGCTRGGAREIPAAEKPIPVGILHSLTGTMAISEAPVADATRLAIEEINRAGGVLGRRLEVVIADGRSNPAIFAAEAERLISTEQVAVVFGCWTSASRKTVRPVFEKHRHLLFYPVQYEGLEQSKNIIYTGPAPNQQINPAVKWAMHRIGRRMFLVGSDYVFPRTANEIIRAQLAALGGEVVGEEYILLGSTEVERAVNRIVATQPDIILNTINGDTNLAFFRALRQRGITPRKIPTLNFSMAEVELTALGAEDMAGDYAAWNYFQSIESPENAAFVAAFKARFGQDRVTDHPMEAAYVGVHLWARAVREARTTEVDAVRKALFNQSYPAPEGVVFVDPENNHTWKVVRIGKIKPDGQFDIVWTSEQPVQPKPFPHYKKISEWDAFLGRLFRGWNESWTNTDR